MDTRLLSGINERAKPGDRLVCVGDFLCRGNERGVPGRNLPWTFYADQIKARLVLLEGNHDKNNHVKPAGMFLFGQMSHFRFLASHWPTENEDMDPLLVDYAKRSCAFVLCGHVHNAWKTKRIDGLLNINVGVDVWNYRPVSDDEILELYRKEIQ